jgi:hypothetical protein
MRISSPTTTSISERLERDAVQVIECTLPADMTLDEWRRRRPRAPHRRRRRPLRQTRTPVAARHLAAVPDSPSDPPPLAA